MTKTTVPFGDFRPDIATIDNQFVSVAENVYPGANAYLPIPALSFTYAGSLGTGNDGYTKVMLYFDGADASTTITDNNMGSVARTWTVHGDAQIDTAQSKFGGSSLLLDGTGDYIDTPASTEFAFTTNDFTISCHYRPNANGTFHVLAGQGDATTTASQSCFQLFRDNNNKLNFQLSNGSAFTSIVGSTASLVTGAWYYVVAQRSGNTLTLAVDGVSEGTASFSGSANTSPNKLAVGAAGENLGNLVNGWIDGFRIDVGVARGITAPSADFDSCRGIFQAKMTDGKDAFFAGTVRKIYKLTHSSGAWTDVTRSASPYSLAPGDLWSGTQFGANFYMTQISDNLQSIDATSGSNFADTSGSPPKAGHVHTLSDRLVLSTLASDKKAIHWSATEDPTGWTIGTNLSDSQSFPDGGDVVGVAGDTIAIVLQERALRAMQFLPGDTDRIFAFSKIENEKGCVGKRAFVWRNNTLFFRAYDGFYAWSNGLQPIGNQAVNNWFNANFLSGRYSQIVAVAPDDATRILWAGHNAANPQFYDRGWIYDWSLNKWSYTTQGAMMWANVANSAKVRILGGVDTSGRFTTLAGTNQAATIDTAEAHLNPGMRTLVTGIYSLVDGVATVTITPYTREDLNDTATAGTATTLQTQTGWAPVLSSGRLHKARVGIAALAWNTAQGIIVDHQPDGEA